MKKIKFFILSLFVLTPLFFSGYSLAQEESSPITTNEPTSVLVAMVDVRDARIMSQEGNVFNIAFTLTNGTGIQGGIKYGIQLVPDGSPYIAHEKVYDESVTLLENSDVKREIVYTAPAILSGSYNLILVAKNGSNFPFGMGILGKVNLTSSVKGVKIANDSCYLEVEGEKTKTKYKINENVDINSSESLILTCTAINDGEAVSLTPFYETKNFSSFGKTKEQIGGSYEQISFNKGEKKSFSVTLPKIGNPDFYSVRFALSKEGYYSNEVYINYILNGINAEVQKISLDKDYYATGDNGEMKVLWSMLPSSFKRGGNTPNYNTNLILEATIKNEKGSKCAPVIKEELVRNPSNPENIVKFKSRNNCLNPSVSVTLKDKSGNVLDVKEFSFTSDSSNINPSNKNKIIIGIVILLILVGGYSAHRNRKNISNNS